MRSAAATFVFSDLRGRIRTSNEEQLRKATRLREFIEASSSTNAAGETTLPKEKQEALRILMSERDATIEAWLNAYNDACTHYLAGEVDPVTFAQAFGAEIREIFEIPGPHSSLLRERISEYSALYGARERLNATAVAIKS